jgi:hypothetical protein
MTGFSQVHSQRKKKKSWAQQDWHFTEKTNISGLRRQSLLAAWHFTEHVVLS